MSFIADNYILSSSLLDYGVGNSREFHSNTGWNLSILGEEKVKKNSAVADSFFAYVHTLVATSCFARNQNLVAIPVTFLYRIHWMAESKLCYLLREIFLTWICEN